MNGVKKPPLTTVEESRHLGENVFDKEHNKLTIKMAKYPNNADSILTTLHLATVQPELPVASSLDSNQSTPK